MLRAYVGVAKPEGLVYFFPDEDHRTCTIAGQSASFWAVVSENVAEQIQREMDAGEGFLALQVLDSMANEIHPLARTSATGELARYGDQAD